MVPLRAISEAFECEVHWNGDTKTIRIYSPASAYVNSVEKLAETITDDNGNVLIEAVAYYPVFENPTSIPCLDAINTDYKLDADKFMEEAKAKKEDAMFLKENVVYPLPETLDVNTLDNCTVPVSLEKGGVYVDDSGKTVMDVTIYAGKLYDMADISSLEEGSVIVRRCEEIKITEIERLESGLVRINGGEENGGFDLISNDDTVYYEVGMDNVKAYYELCKLTLPLSDKFEYTDKNTKEKQYSAADFLSEDSEIEYNFYPSNTSIVIENGTVIKMEKIYNP